jgi:hypothetical protein
MRSVSFLLIFALLLSSYSLFAQETQKYRAIILADIAAEPDDTQ